ncbi:MAG TPA: AMP-binding protein [Mycobacteriales bacterium]|nr:AMP-binding protein [Mycobacteriales bacterium]
MRSPTGTFRAARDLLLACRDDPDRADAEFRWPRFDSFNWALDWFDAVAAGNDGPALRVVSAGGWQQRSFAQLARRSDQVANWLRARGVRRGDPVLVALPNRVELWEALLALMKLGAVIVPTYPTVTRPEIVDRLTRAGVRHVLVDAALTGLFDGELGARTAITVGGSRPGWVDFAGSERAAEPFEPDRPTGPDEPLFYYFTSGTTAAPKMVVHTHTSYPVGHLSGMYWNGVRPGDRHLNLASPGWAKHAWSSVFVPWNAEATVVALDVPAPDPGFVLDVLREHRITSFCAPPTFWRRLLGGPDAGRPPALREVVSAGEPLGADLVERVRARWGLTVRDGYGQTETTAQIGQPPGRPGTPGSMGRPLPGYRIALRDPSTGGPAAPGAPGEICIDLADRPAGLTAGYRGDADRSAALFAGGWYHTGDLASRGPDGQLSYLGRADDTFKSADHRISPLELEQAVRRHPGVEQVAVVPVDHPVDRYVPKAYVIPRAGWAPGAATAAALAAHLVAVLPAEKRVRLVQFVGVLPHTASGKVHRRALREHPPAGPEYPLGDPAG